jgi:DNA-binding transcriptional LysR family regulator
MRTIATTATPRDLTDMLIFARVVEAKSFTAAAARLGLSKSVVSARVLDLEERLATRLLHRTTRRLALTDDGVRFYERCARVAGEADQAVAESAGERGAIRGAIRVSGPEGFGQRHLVAPLAAFGARHAEVRLELSVTDRLVDVVGEGFHLAVRIAPRLADSSLVARRLVGDRMLVCASPAYVSGRGAPASAAELVHHACLRYSLLDPREEWDFAGSDGRPLAVSVDGPFAASSGTLLRAAALAGLGIAILPESEVAEELAAGQLVELLPGALRNATLGVHALHGFGGKPPARVRALVDHLVAWFAEPRWPRAASTRAGRPAARARAAPRPAASRR